MVDKKTKILKAICVFMIILIIAILILTKIPEEEPVTDGQKVEIMSQKVENEAVNLLVDKNEEERMRYYLKEFIEFIDLEQYEEAYKVLNSDFKNNYFKTFEEFKQYATTKFPSTISVVYDNFERAGDVYIFWTTLINPLTSAKKDAQGKVEGLQMNFVIKENDLNDFEMSFSVIK